MTPVLVVIGVLVAIAITLLVTLAVRHVMLARRDRRTADGERRMRPVAIELLEGTGEPPPLASADRAALAAAIGRYSRKVSGATAVRIAQYFRDSGGLDAAFAGMGARAPWRRASAAYSLGDMACSEAVPVLIDALDDRSDEVRAAAVRSLGRLRDPSVAEPLVESLVARRVPRGMTGAALLEIGAPAVPELRRIARHENPRVRAVAVTVLGLVGDSGDADLALAALSDPIADVRAAAARALARIGMSAAEPALRTALDDDAPVVRAEAAAAMGAIHAKQAVPRLLHIARTDRFRPARAAAQAVAEIDRAILAEAAARPGAGAHLHEAADLAAL
ncbi:MAG TPA: HEAT repeat domain-containing protein [Solirubrobacteraceae bacterium]|nr:HEAT repeat domain-containing protein [Solirubrobacteraceae bacterium]